MTRVLEDAQAAGIPVYLESTVEAVKMYQELGFVAVDEFRMKIPKRGCTEPDEEYEELCMLWSPRPC